MHKSMTSKEARFWDKKARGYAKSPIADMDAYERTLERTRAHLKPSDHILELGCGTGSTALRLAGQVAKVTASDVSSEMVQIGREKAQAQGCENIEFVAAAAGEGLQGQYDVVLAFNLLHLLPDVDDTLQQVHRLLKPGGLFVSKTFCIPEKFSLKVSAIRTLLPVMQLFNQAPGKVNFWQVAQLDALVIRSGFGVIEQGAYPEHPPRRFLVAQKPTAQ